MVITINHLKLVDVLSFMREYYDKMYQFKSFIQNFVRNLDIINSSSESLSVNNYIMYLDNP